MSGFIPPMLATILRDPTRLDDPAYLAEPKLDGQRAQLHISDGRVVHAFSRPGRELLQHRGLAWLAGIRWPVDHAIFDGELFQGNGADGIDSVLTARTRDGADLAVALFDVLAVKGRLVMREAWADRRARLEALMSLAPDPRVQLVPAIADARALWRAWVDHHGGEGIVLKDRSATYRPGIRSGAWLKAKQHLDLTVDVLEALAELVAWGDWGQAAMLRFCYCHPRTGELVTVRQAVRVLDPQRWSARGKRLVVRCWGVMPSGLLRHPEIRS
jgi:ATP-dependent DNA ligase